MTNRKKIYIVTALLICSALLIIIVNYMNGNQNGRVPFNDLDPEEIVSIKAHYGSEDKFPIYELSAEEVEILVQYLKDVVLYTKADYMQYGGSLSLMFTIEMVNGDKVQISASSPLFIIDQVGFESDPVQCNKIGDLYWDCVEKIRAASGQN